VDNLWALGGEIIRDLNQDPSLRRKDKSILDNRIDEEGGPLVYAMESEEPLQRSLDSKPEALPLPQPLDPLTDQITHKFPERGYAHGVYTVTLNGPWAVYRNRTRSVPDELNGVHGDAAFADFTILFSMSRRF